MNKSVYSLVLMDDVVEAVDRMAYSMNTSRSNLINQILAEYVSCITPEKRMKDIFTEVERIINSLDCFQVQLQPSDSMLSIKSALKYKYKPTVRYKVLLYRNAADAVGELKVNFRTQSQHLISSLNDFFSYWIGLERKYLTGMLGFELTYAVEDGKYTRVFMVPEDGEKQSDDSIGKAIAEYIRTFDDTLKLYFVYMDDMTTALDKMENNYIDRLQSGVTII